MYNTFVEFNFGGKTMFELLTLEATSTATGSGSSIGMIVLLVVMVAGMYFLMIRPQRKQQKKDQEMRESTQVGDEITTIGGIMGRVVTVKEDSLIIETGADRNKMKIARWAIQVNNTATEKMRAEQEAAKAAAAKEREEKAAKKKKGKKADSDKA